MNAAEAVAKIERLATEQKERERRERAEMTCWHDRAEPDTKPDTDENTIYRCPQCGDSWNTGEKEKTHNESPQNAVAHPVLP